MKYIPLVLAIIILFGCKKEPMEPSGTSTTALHAEKLFDLNDTTEVKTGQTVGMTNGGLVFRFDSVINDSRCPVGIECIWVGSATIHLTFQETTGISDTIFEHGQVAYGNYKIILIELSPYPIWQQTIDKSSYIAKFIVTQ
jgi:hypothetical protein